MDTGTTSWYKRRSQGLRDNLMVTARTTGTHGRLHGSSDTSKDLETHERLHVTSDVLKYPGTTS